MNKKLKPMKNFYILFIATLLFSCSSMSKIENENKTTEKFDVFNPNENDRPNQFLTSYLRDHKRLNLSRSIKAILSNPNLYSDSQNSLRDQGKFGNGTTSLTSIFLDDVQIFGEGINRLFVIENTRTNEIEKISRSSVGYDKTIRIYSK